jgi:aspartate racemase
MRRIGIVGGIGPESTLDYYRRIVAALAARGPGERPDVVIYGANVDELFTLVSAKDWDGLAGWLLAKIEALRGAGADFAAISANTPHVVFDRVKARSPLPLRSIVEATRDEASRRGVRRVGLLGTRFTMQADFYARCLEPAGMQVFVPDAAEQELIHRRLMEEIELGVFKDSTRAELLAIAARLRRVHAVDAVILGCTELPLILDRDAYPVAEEGPPIPFLNTTAIHVDDIVRFATA